MKFEPRKFKSRFEAVEFIQKAGISGVVTRKDAERWMNDHIPPEKEWQRKIILWLRENFPEAVVWKAAAGPYSRGGIPDITVIYKGVYIGMEVKRPFIGGPTKLQEQTIRQIRRAGAVAGVVSFERDAARLMEEAHAVAEGRRLKW